MKTTTKQRILEQAARLFFAEGFSIGIDHVTHECAVAKMTIYGHFKSKDGLIRAILETVQRSLDDRIQKIVEPTSNTADRLQMTFNIICHGMNDPELRLGLGVRAIMEFPKPSHPVHLAALALDRGILKHLDGESDADRGETAQALLLLAKGCFLAGQSQSFRKSREIASDLAKQTLAARDQIKL